MKLRTLLLTASLLAPAVALPRIALAQPQDATSAAAAEKLFQEGRTLIEQGRWVDACPKLAESLRLDPAVGTALNLAECYERVDRIASAWVTYRRAETMARRANQRERYTHAAARAEQLESKLSYLTVSVPTHPKGLVVMRDGERIGDAAWGTAVPVDGGSHVIEASAPGRRTWKHEVKVNARSTRTTVEIPELEVLPSDAPLGDAPASPPIQRTIGWVAAATGVVTLGAGFAFGAIAKSQYDDAGTHCSAVDCDARGVALTGDARSSATISTVLFVAGGVVTAAGVVLVLTAPKREGAAGTRVGLSLSPTGYGAWATF
jgi:hypothetical protein